MSAEYKSWREIPNGGLILEAGNAFEYNTGNWRAFRPVLEPEKCNDCMLCWLFCPDSSILVDGQKLTGFDYEHCKGCGLCAALCPTKSVSMHPESEFTGEVRS